MRMLHTMLRVGDLERSLAFYTEVLGMQLLRRKDYPSGRFTLAFVGYGDEKTTPFLSSPTTGRRRATSSVMVMAISRLEWKTSTPPALASPAREAGW